MRIQNGYWQIKVRESGRWLTALLSEGSLYAWCRMPFGLKTAWNTFCRREGLVLQPIRDFSLPFVDDRTIRTKSWSCHLFDLHLEIRKSSLTFSLRKCKLAQREMRFVAHIVNTGHHRPDERKLNTISTLTRLSAKKCSENAGIFNYFQSYLLHLAELSVSFTD